MNRFLIATAIVSLSALSGFAQHDDKKFHIFTENGETYGETDLPEVLLTTRGLDTRDARKMSVKYQEDLRQLEWSAHKVYPYARRFGEIMYDLNRQLAATDKNSAKRKQIKQKEEEMFAAYEAELRKFNENQGRVFVKLVCRQTGQSMYDIVKEKRSAVGAMFWQSLTQVWDIDLKSRYYPTSDEWDIIIEKYVRELESGGYNKVYKANNYVVR